MSHGTELTMDLVPYGLRFVARVVVLAAALFVIGFVVFANSIEEGRADVERRAEGIVVLTGGQARIAAAVDLLAAGKARRLLISGVYPDTTEEAIANLIPQSVGLFDCCIDLDKRAQNTMDNASEARIWAERHGFESLIIVTSSYHMPRALAELERVMPEVDLIPYAVTPPALSTEKWWTDARTMRLLLKEYVKYIPAATLLGAARLARYVAAEPPSRPQRRAG